MFWSFVMGALVLLPASVGAAIQVWPHTPMGKMLEPPTNEEVTPFAAEQQRLGNLVGKFGDTVTPLNPAGMLQIAGERLHCFSEGPIVERGVRVRVLAVQGNRLMVRMATDKEQTVDESELPLIQGSAAVEPTVKRLVADGDFDFDLPSDKLPR
jgi:membrane protein implicated in regulation of membrane protease activity